MEPEAQVRVGIVGCGYQGRLMAQAMAEVSSLRVTGCADPIRDAAASVSALAGHSNVYLSADELLEKGEVDAVIVATPHHVLGEIALAAVVARKHVLAEKPIAMNEQDATSIEAAVTQAGVCYMAGYSLRFFVAQQQVHDLLAAGAVGEIQAVQAGIGQPPLSDWFARAEMGGGALLYLGSHLVDEVLWYVQDEPIEVHADVRYREDTGTDETSMFQIRFARGAVAQCLVTQAADSWFDFVNIYGSEGQIGLKAANWLRHEISISSKIISAYEQPTRIYPRLRGDPIMMMLVPELEEFAAAIQGNRQPAITASDGRRVLRILDAVVKSGQAGGPVPVS